MKTKFILLHFADDNTPFVIRTDIILSIRRHTDGHGGFLSKTILVIDNKGIEDETLPHEIECNESIEKIYEMISGE